MKYSDWHSLHIDAYKAYMRQKYGQDLELAIKPNKLTKILEIRDEDKFDKELIKLKQCDIDE